MLKHSIIGLARHQASDRKRLLKAIGSVNLRMETIVKSLQQSTMEDKLNDVLIGEVET